MKALLVIDIQKRLTDKKGFYNLNGFISNVNNTIGKFRENNDFIVFVMHNDKFLIQGSSDWEFDRRIDKRENDRTIQKFHGDSFRKTGLPGILKEKNIVQVYICGLVSHACIKHTCKGSLKEGFETFLVEKAHNCWDKNAKTLILKTEEELINLGVKKINTENL
jgi:nicotinamidase-related amidase